jgi:hypothetical protein
VGQAPPRGAAACAGAGAAQGVGLRWLRHHSRLCAHRPPLGGGRPGGVGWAAATGVLWGLSYFFWRRVQATPASAYDESMKKSGASQAQSASELISKRIAELGDWRGEILSRMRKLIKKADPDVVLLY